MPRRRWSQADFLSDHSTLFGERFTRRRQSIILSPRAICVARIPCENQPREVVLSLSPSTGFGDKIPPPLSFAYLDDPGVSVLIRWWDEEAKSDNSLRSDQHTKQVS